MIRRETTIETRKDVALDMIRYDREHKISAEDTRERIRTILFTDDEIDNLFAQVEEEEKALV